MKVGVAQINAVVGDFPGNAKRILAAYRECMDAGAELVVTPEMSLVGFPPRDLVFHSKFVPLCLQALDYLAGETGEIPLVVGYVDFHANHEGGEALRGKPFRNAVAWLRLGQVLHRRYKTRLPSYDVFDEGRYFEPAEENPAISHHGQRIGLVIGEDIWPDESLPGPLYGAKPVGDFEGGLDLMLHLSASPFDLGKLRQRRGAVSKIACTWHAPVVHCNGIGANDELIFDGHSLVVDPAGREIALLAGFREQCRVVETSPPAAGSARETMCDEEMLFGALVLGVRDFAGKCGFTSACLGLSGGVGSALVAAIALAALGAEKVFGVTISPTHSAGGGAAEPVELANNLGISWREMSISAAFSGMREALDSGLDEDLEEVVQARLRGGLLMAFASQNHHLLLTSDDKSDLAIGNRAIFGDLCGGLAVLSDLPKTWVFKVSRWVNRQREIISWEAIENPPGHGVRSGPQRQERMPPDEILDEIIEMFLERQFSSDQIIALGHDETQVRWVQRRMDLNGWKRVQAVPGLRVTAKAFGSGLRLPIAHRFAG